MARYGQDACGNWHVDRGMGFVSLGQTQILPLIQNALSRLMTVTTGLSKVSGAVAELNAAIHPGAVRSMIVPGAAEEEPTRTGLGRRC